MTEKKISTKHGVIRPDRFYGYSGYVTMGEKYFSVDELDIIMDYIDRGYIVKENKYIMQGGKTVEYLYKYIDHHGERVSESIEHVEYPIMIMVTRLQKAD
jgi:hypothetical protein